MTKSRIVLRCLALFFLIALLPACSVAKKQIVPQDVGPEALLHGLYERESIQSVKSVSTLPLHEISEIDTNMNLYYQYAFLVKGAVNQENNPVPDKLYVIAAVENRREDQEVSIEDFEGNINGEIVNMAPRHHTFDVNVCYGKTKSECDPKKNPPIQVHSIYFDLDQFKSFKPKQENIVDISVSYALGASKKELREQFLSDSGLQNVGEESVTLQLPADFY